MDYVAPESIADACRALEADGAHCLAGGQSLVAMMNVGLATPNRLVSLRKIAALRGIALAPGGGLRIGAMTTHAELAALDARSPGAKLIAQAARVVAYPAIRNRGTIGGSVALADPAADYPVALTAIDAVIEVLSLRGERQIRAREFFRGVFDTALERGEIVAAIRIPAGPTAAGTAYEKLSLVAGDFAIISVAAVVADGVSVAVGGLAPKPLGLTCPDRSSGSIGAAIRRLVEDSDPPSDHRASSAYRRRVASALIERAIRAAERQALR